MNLNEIKVFLEDYFNKPALETSLQGKPFVQKHIEGPVYFQWQAFTKFK